MTNSTRGSALFSVSNKYMRTGHAAVGLFLVVTALVSITLPAARAAEQNWALPPSLPEQQFPQRTRSGIHVTGNHDIDTDVLLEAAAEELQNFRQKGFKKTDADDAAYQMELTYRRLGYRFATVDYNLEQTAKAGWNLIFIVQEGVRVRLADIILTGNAGVSTETLLDFFAAEAEDSAVEEGWFVETVIMEAIEAIRIYYYTNGYLKAVVSSPRLTFSEDKSTVTVQVMIDEGTLFLVQDLVLTGDLLPEIREELAEIRKSVAGKPYVPRQTAFLLESRVTELYGDLGYPDVSVEVKDNRPENGVSGAVALKVQIDSGPRVTISGIRITGNVKTRREFIISRLKLAEGDTYSSAKKRDSFSRLYRTGLFSLVRVTLVETDSQTERLLLVELEELPHREVSLELGWGSYELLRGKVEMRSKNFTGKGRILSGSAEASLKSTDLSFGFSDPWLLGHDLVLNLPIYYRTRIEPSFERTERGISTVLSKHFPEQKVGLSLAYTLRYTQQFNVTAGVVEAGDNYNFASLKLQAYRDIRDDLFFPAAGYRSVLAIELTDQWLGSSLAFARFTTYNRFFHAVGKRTVLALRYDTGFVVPTTEDLTLPLAERFFNGGENKVRSFRESELGPKDPESGDPIGGSAYNVVSVELRHRFKNNFGGSIFLDYGNIVPSSEGGLDSFTDRDDFISATFRDYFSHFRPAVGVGVLYLLPVGPIRIDAAYNPSVDDEQREDQFIVHFTVGMAF